MPNGISEVIYIAKSITITDNYMNKYFTMDAGIIGDTTLTCY